LAQRCQRPLARLTLTFCLRWPTSRRPDLIVAGAYGRSRLSEWIFGGVTRTLLTASKVPMLFAN